jgi:site-specific recombinase XerD
MATAIQTLKREFLEYMEIERGASLKTIANYDRYVDRFFTHANITEPKDINDDKIREFRLMLNRAPGVHVKGQARGTMKKNSQNYHLIALRRFLKYLMKRGITALSPERIELAKVGARQIDMISGGELKRLLSAPTAATLIGLRDKALLELFFSTGLRLSELCSLNRDLDLSKDEFSIRGKGEKIRVVFLSDTAKDAVRTYLTKRADMDEPLFIQHSRNKKKRCSSPDTAIYRTSRKTVCDQSRYFP